MDQFNLIARGFSPAGEQILERKSNIHQKHVAGVLIHCSDCIADRVHTILTDWPSHYSDVVRITFDVAL